MTGVRSGKRIGGAALAATLVLTLSRCGGPPQVGGGNAGNQPAPERATPAPGFAVVDEAQHAQLMQYGQGLEFVTSVTAIDEQLLVRGNPGGALTVGPWMSLAPEKGAATLTRADLAGGRTIARALLASGSDTITAYWYVDSVAAGWRSIWTTSHPTHRFFVSSLVVHSHGGPAFPVLPRTRIIVQLAGPVPPPGSGTCGICTETRDWCRDTLFSLTMAPVLGSLPPWALP
jgi:hypothetical protein